MNRTAILLALAPAALVGACTPDYGGVYPLGIDDVRSRLLQTGPPRFLFGHNDVDIAARRESDTRIVWIVRHRHSELMRYVAELAAVDPKSTRVTLSLVGATEGRFGNVEERLAHNPSVRNLHLAAMQERVASRIERRQFRMARIYPAMGAAAAANIGAISGQMEEAGKAMQRRDRENIEKAYRDEARGIRH